jgi:hypothetical protein
MKRLTALILVILYVCVAATNVSAQAAGTIWLSASTTTYATGETVMVTVNAVSATPIQGFTFQIRYDPACLQVVNAASPIPGMNGLSLPQITGVVDASFASTTPQTANGVLAQVRFLALATCQTNLTLESAALAIRNSSGFAAPLSNMALGEKSVALSIEKSAGAPQATEPVVGTPLPLGPEPESGAGLPVLPIVLIGFFVVAIFAFVLYLLFRKKPPA